MESPRIGCPVCPPYRLDPPQGVLPLAKTLTEELIEAEKERDEWKAKAEKTAAALVMLLDSLEEVDPESIRSIRKSFFDQINGR